MPKYCIKLLNYNTYKYNQDYYTLNQVKVHIFDVFLMGTFAIYNCLEFVYKVKYDISLPFSTVGCSTSVKMIYKFIFPYTILFF